MPEVIEDTTLARPVAGWKLLGHVLELLANGEDCNLKKAVLQIGGIAILEPPMTKQSQVAVQVLGALGDGHGIRPIDFGLKPAIRSPVYPGDTVIAIGCLAGDLVLRRTEPGVFEVEIRGRGRGQKVSLPCCHRPQASAASSMVSWPAPGGDEVRVPSNLSHRGRLSEVLKRLTTCGMTESPRARISTNAGSLIALRVEPRLAVDSSSSSASSSKLSRIVAHSLSRLSSPSTRSKAGASFGKDPSKTSSSRFLVAGLTASPVLISYLLLAAR